MNNEDTRYKAGYSEDVIDLREVFHALSRRAAILIACLLVGGVLLFAISAFTLPKMYLSSVELYVNNTEIKAGGDVTTSDIDASRRLSNTYIVVLQNPAVRAQVITELGGELTQDDLEEYVTIMAVEDTEVVRISATTESIALSAQICNTYADVAPGVLERVVQAGSVEIIGAATQDTEPVSPNIPRNTAIGALAGLIIAIIVVYLQFAFDTTIKTAADLKQRIEIPVLGEIPAFQSPGGRKGR
jgi:capsular polysaccharide biosynthesis protein